MTAAYASGTTVTSHHDSTWSDRAACKGLKGDALNAFFAADHENRGHAPLRVLAAAKRYCANCPVIAECGAAADAGFDEGLWGGAWRYRTQNAANQRVYRSQQLVQPNGATTATRPAGRVRRHVRTLLKRGWTRIMIANAARVSRDTITSLLAAEQSRLHPDVAAALMAVRGAPPGQAKP